MTWIQSKYEDIPRVVNEEIADDYPKGCSVLVLKDHDYGIYFNTHSSGNPDEDYRQVCKEEAIRKSPEIRGQNFSTRGKPSEIGELYLLR